MSRQKIGAFLNKIHHKNKLKNKNDAVSCQYKFKYAKLFFFYSIERTIKDVSPNIFDLKKKNHRKKSMSMN